jgi:hypothetical protein
MTALEGVDAAATANFDILRLLCSSPAEARLPKEKLRAIVHQRPDWSEVLAAADEHGVTPLICKRIDGPGAEDVEPGWRERLREEWIRNSCRNLLLVSELARVLAALEACAVLATPYKGPVLAEQVYGDLALRQFTDLDVIVPQRQIVAAHSAVVKAGYHPVLAESGPPQADRNIPGQYAYTNESGTRLELHTEATLRYFPRPFNLEALCERRQMISLAGRRVPSFSMEDTLILLSVHGSKHFWERLAWIADIAALASRPRSMDWPLALERARELGAERMVLLGAGLAHDLLDLDLPGEVALGLKRDHVARRLIDGICQGHSKRQMELGIFSRLRFRMCMRGSGPEGLRYAFRLATTPTELDRNESRVSGSLGLYTILRPLRLLRLYGWRTRIKC